MNYRMYLNGTKGYEILGTYDLKETMCTLDRLILEKKIKRKILVIEHNVKEDSDYPVFLFWGEKEEYLDFKENLQHSRIEQSGSLLVSLAKGRRFKSSSCNQKKLNKS